MANLLQIGTIKDGVTNYEEYVSDTDPRANDDTSDEVETFVTRFYKLCLDRNPDQTGLNGWVTTLLTGTPTESDVAYGFVFSFAFVTKKINDEKYPTTFSAEYLY